MHAQPWMNEPMAAEDWQLQLVDALTSLCAGKSSRAVRLVVTGAYLRSWSQSVPAGTRSLADLRAVSMARCLQLFGGEPSDWRITADWHSRGRFVCMGIPGWIAHALKSTGRGSIDTLWGLGILGGRMSSGWICLSAVESGAVISIECGRMTTLRSFELAAELELRTAQMRLELRRASLREGLETNAEVPWIDAIAMTAHPCEQDGQRFARKPLLPERPLQTPPRCDGEVAALLALTGALKQTI